MCDEYKAMSLPTLMYFEPPISKKGFVFEGNRTAADLIGFAEELGSSCAPSALDACSDAQKAYFEEYSAMDVAALKEKAGGLMMKADMAKFQVRAGCG